MKVLNQIQQDKVMKQDPLAKEILTSNQQKQTKHMRLESHRSIDSADSENFPSDIKILD